MSAQEGIALAGASFNQINYLAVVAAVVVNMAGGALWYSQILFAKPWMTQVGMTEADIRHRRGAAYRGYAITFGASIIVAMVLALLVEGTGATTPGSGIVLGLLVGIGFVATSHAAGYIFEGRSLTLYLINMGYHLSSLTIQGLLLATWR